MSKTNRLFYFLSVFILLKVLVYIRKGHELAPPPSEEIPPIKVETGLGPVDNGDGTINILNMKNVSYILSPGGCVARDWMMIMVASAPLNRHLRDNWRHDTKQRPGVKTVFLVARAKTQADQAALEQEALAYADIVQCDVPDGHRVLAYKNLCGHVWAYQHCPGVRHTVKSDDNVRVDLDTLTTHLTTDTVTQYQDLITCPTLCFGMRVIRSDAAQMNGNWSHSREEWTRDTIPPFCVGFLSLTTPQVGAKLAQVGLQLYGDQDTPVTLIEDSLITGILKERLPEVRLEMMFLGQWKTVLTWCPFIHVVKQTFFNDLILSKISSRSNVHYVGPVTNPHVWKFFICSHMEGVFMLIEGLMPNIVPSFLWNICKR